MTEQSSAPSAENSSQTETDQAAKTPAGRPKAAQPDSFWVIEGGQIWGNVNLENSSPVEKPITWIPLIWGVVCGAASSGGLTAGGSRMWADCRRLYADVRAAVGGLYPDSE